MPNKWKVIQLMYDKYVIGSREKSMSVRGKEILERDRDASFISLPPAGGGSKGGGIFKQLQRQASGSHALYVF